LPSGSSLQETYPPWWRGAVFYEIFVRSFYDTDGDGVGDFNGIARKLDYLRALGIDAIWLMPIHPSPSYHGYDVLNFYAVNPQYGTMDDFKRLLQQVHARGMHLIIDLVLNHTSNRHPFFVDALRGAGSPYHDWYLWSDTGQGSGWHPLQTGAAPHYYYGMFCDCMPDLNYTNPAVTAQMEKVVRFWIKEVGVDGFRVDAAKHLIEQDGQTENTPATHAWLRDFHAAYKADGPSIYTVGEVYGAGGLLAKTYSGDQLDQIFNFELASGYVNSAAGAYNTGINSALIFTLKDMPDGNYAVFLTNHDQNRVMSVMNGDMNKARLAAFLMLTGPGTPFIYYGEEIGMQGKKPDEDIRLPMQWESGPNAGFSSGLPWHAPAENYQQVNVAKELDDPNSLLAFYRRLIQLRVQHPALRTGGVALLEAGNPRVFASLRTDGDETILLIANLGNELMADSPLTLRGSGLTAGSYRVSTLYGAADFATLTAEANGTIALRPAAEIPAYGMYVLGVMPAK